MVPEFCSTSSAFWEVQLKLRTKHTFASSHFLSKIKRESSLQQSVCLLWHGHTQM